MDAQGSLRQDLKCPDDTEEDQKNTEKIKQLLADGQQVTVTVLESMKIEKIVEVAQDKSK